MIRGKNRLYLIFYGLIALFLGLRIWRFWHPKEVVFDEVYFPQMAQQYLKGEQFFDIHPPLGKLLIALAQSVFGDTFFAWRIAPLIAGIALVAIVYIFVMRLFEKRGIALLASLFVAIDGLFIVYSRIGLIDLFMLDFGFLSALYCLIFARQKRLVYLLVSALFLGLAIAVKWIGLGFFALNIVILVLYLDQSFWRIRTIARTILVILIMSLIALGIYCLSYVINWQDHYWANFWQWHKQALHYNIYLTDSHTYQSAAYSWPLMLRPIWFYYSSEGSTVRGIIAAANPLLLYSTSLAIVATAIYQLKTHFSNKAVSIAMLGFIIFYVPWLFVSRPLFFYHYMTSYLFAIIVLAWTIYSMRIKVKYIYIGIWLIIILCTSIVYLPFWLGLPIPENYLRIFIPNGWI